MKEIELEKLMRVYSDSLGTCSRQPMQAARRALWRPMVAATCFAVIAGLVTVVAWPHNAAAATLHRIGDAISNAKTMEEEYWMQTPTGRWRSFERVYYGNGAWRYEVRISLPRAVTIVVRNGAVLTDYHRLDHATLAPGNTLDGEIPRQRDALDYAKASLGEGLDPSPSVKVRDHATVDGAPAYSINLDRPDNDFHAEILVDRRTDLPISSTISVRHGEETLHYRQAYHFNLPLSDDLFALKTDKPVVDLPQAQRSLAARWSKPLLVVDGCQVRDASITTDGTIWVATSADGKHEPSDYDDRPVTMPTAITTSSGALYTATGDYSSTMFGRSNFTLNGKSVYLVGFVPLRQTKELPRSVSISFTRRALYWPNQKLRPEAAEKPVPVGVAQVVRLRPQRTETPDYLTTFDFDRFGLELPAVVCQVRAAALEKSGQIAEAAKAYEQEAIAYSQFVPYHATVPLASAEHCYEVAGMKADAARVHEWAERVRLAN